MLDILLSLRIFRMISFPASLFSENPHTCGGAIIFSLSELLHVTIEFKVPQTRNSARGVPYLPGLEGSRTRSASTGPPARRPSGAGPQFPAGCFTHFLREVLPSTLPGAEPVRVGAPEPM